jgi:hypothetical protein
VSLFPAENNKYKEADGNLKVRKFFAVIIEELFST